MTPHVAVNKIIYVSFKTGDIIYYRREFIIDVNGSMPLI